MRIESIPVLYNKFTIKLTTFHDDKKLIYNKILIFAIWEIAERQRPIQLNYDELTFFNNSHWKSSNFYL